MARKGDGLVKPSETWWLDFTHIRERYQVRLGRKISKTVAREIATVERGKALKQEAGIGKKRKDIAFNKASDEFLKWAKANKRPSTAAFYGFCLVSLSEHFGEMKLSQISQFSIEKYKQALLAAGFKVGVNRELSTLNRLFNLGI